MKAMRKYYVFAILLSAVVLAIVAAVLVSDNPRRHDRVVYTSANRIVQNVTSYVNADTKRGIPASVEAVYAKNVPTNVTYARVNDKLFSVCGDFKQARNENGSYESYGYDSEGQYRTAKAYVDQQKAADPQVTYWFVGTYMSDYDAHYRAGKNCFVAQAISDEVTSTNSKYPLDIYGMPQSSSE